MTTTQNTDDLLIINDEVKTDSDFLFFDTPVEEAKTEDSIISFEETKVEEKDSSIDFFSSFSTTSESKEEIKDTTSLETETNDFSFDIPLVKTEDVMEEAKEEANDEINNFSFETPIVSEIKEEIYSSQVTESMTNTVWDLNAILEETISKLELRKTNLWALKTDKTSTIDDLNKQIEALKSQVKELQWEVKWLESEDEQIVNNITALQSMKMGEVINNKNIKKEISKKAA